MSFTAWVRMACRLPALIVWTLIIFLIRCCTKPIKLLSIRLDRDVRGVLFRLWGKGAVAILGGRIRVHGPVPEPPFFLVSNHLTYLDVFALAGVVSPVFVAKSEIATWPLVGFLIGQLETVFIKRERPRDAHLVMEVIEDVFDKGFGVHMFAEGGISQTGEIQPFKPALLDVAARNHHPVYHVAITYRTPNGSLPASAVVAWRIGKTMPSHLAKLAAAHGFEASLTFGDTPLVHEDRKVLAAQLTEAVRERYSLIE